MSLPKLFDEGFKKTPQMMWYRLFGMKVTFQAACGRAQPSSNLFLFSSASELIEFVQIKKHVIYSLNFKFTVFY